MTYSACVLHVLGEEANEVPDAAVQLSAAPDKEDFIMSNMEQLTRVGSPEVLFGELRRNWGWLLALGIVLIILGTIGLGMTFFLTLASTLYFGVLVLIGGGAQIFHSVKAQGWKSTVLSVFIGILYLLSGIAVISNPVAASTVLTLMLAGALIGIGVLRIAMAFHLRGFNNWIWLLLGGIIAILLGVMIVAEWPVSGLWVIGLFVAIELIMNGWSCVAIALTAREGLTIARRG
ncbi:HdeD family acid-resistance protein [Methylocaldum sp.]|uniref:HdeD family acid-resistance protein n=1 Tax=Methylocaldum sp. TaxID=1969727 RepID=UPI002D5D8D24|nr:HdeD family acid-resistance protein [Methylocaldum sp.]HYE35266.1 HdeD family acid-resistance protein [Methylocaldum sp.]